MQKQKSILHLSLFFSLVFIACSETTPVTSTTTSSSASASSSGDGGMGGSAGNGGMGGTGGAGGDSSNKNPLDGMGPVEKLKGNFMFTEGPQWVKATGTLLFSDIPVNKIYEYAAPATFTTFRDPSGNSNGLAVDKNGLLYVCEHSGRRVSKTDSMGVVTTIVDNYQNKKLNSPNDVIIRDDGNIYFTDPPYGLAAPNLSELGFQGVFRVTIAGMVELVSKDMNRPNGIALSPDQNTLYVTDTATAELRAYVLDNEGKPGSMTTVVTTSANPDGMTVDDQGNLYVSTSSGIEVYKSNGKLWGTITIPEQPANCAFGDGDRKTLYVTARTSLYRVTLKVAGMY